MAELDSAGYARKKYTWGLDVSGTAQGAGGVGGLLLVEMNGSSYYPVYDQAGNVRGLLDSGGGVAARYDYDAFGGQYRSNGPKAADNPFRYSTKYADDENGLVYYGLRFYNPETGRFLNRDPIEEAGGLNLYGFVGNSPVNGYDMLGMWPNWLEDLVGGGDDSSGDDSSGDDSSGGGDDGSGPEGDPNDDPDDDEDDGEMLDPYVVVGNDNDPAYLTHLYQQEQMMYEMASEQSQQGRGGNTLEVQGSVGLGGTLGAMLGVIGPFGHGEVNVGISLDLFDRKNSRIFFNHQVAGMIGVGVAADAGPQVGAGVRYGKPSESGKSTNKSLHIEAGVPTPSGAIVSGSGDISRDGVSGAKTRGGLGVSLYAAGGLAETTTYYSPSISEVEAGTVLVREAIKHILLQKL